MNQKNKMKRTLKEIIMMGIFFINQVKSNDKEDKLDFSTKSKTISINLRRKIYDFAPTNKDPSALKNLRTNITQKQNSHTKKKILVKPYPQKAMKHFGTLLTTSKLNGNINKNSLK